MAGLMEEVKGLGFKNKKAAAFGAYGWSGESVKVLNELLKESGFTLVNDGLKGLWNPDEKTAGECVQFGKTFIEALR